MKWSIHVLSLVLAGALFAIGTFIIQYDLYKGVPILLLAVILYVYGYGLKRR